MKRAFIGDVQGCANELDLLLARIDDELGRSAEVWLVGDLVNRGPHDLRVLETVRARVEAGRARVVLGNHELHLLRIAWGLREPGPLDTVQKLLARPDAREWVDWIRHLPLALTGKLGQRRFAMVHAASKPGWSRSRLAERAAAAAEPLAAPGEKTARRYLAGDGSREHDDLMRLVSCRSVTPEGWSSKTPEELPGDAVPWHEAWRERQHGHGLVYGHWSLQRLHVARGLRGLDTGCVHHGRGVNGYLTAWVPDTKKDDPFDVPDDRFWRVKARRAYYRD